MVERGTPIPIGKAARDERRKAAATARNAILVALFISAGLQPLMAGHLSLLAVVTVGAAVVALRALLHYILRQVAD